MRVAPIGFAVASFVIALLTVPPIGAQDDGVKPVSGASVHAFEMKRIDGVPQKLSEYRGKLLLIVNVASECGFTGQYEGLQRLHEKYGARGFTVLGFPSNDFGKQEPGTDPEILKFCSDRYKVTFPLFSKVAVLGPNAVPLYRYLQEESAKKTAVKWNFQKFLVDPDGYVITAFGPKIQPEDPKVIAAIEDALSRFEVTSRPAGENSGVRLAIGAFDGMPLADGSKLSLAAEKDKRLAALREGKPYEPPAGTRWHWRYPVGVAADAADKIRRARAERPADFPDDADLVFYDPEFWGPSKKGFTQADLKSPKPDVDRIGLRTVRVSIKSDRQKDFEAYTKKWINQPIAILVDGEIVTAPHIQSPLREAVVISVSGGFTEAEQKLLIEHLKDTP